MSESGGVARDQHIFLNPFQSGRSKTLWPGLWPRGFGCRGLAPAQQGLNFLPAPVSFNRMRHLLLALLIALLPLRAWVGDAMAVSMLGHPAAHTETSAVMDSVHANCPEHDGDLPASMTHTAGLDHSAHGQGGPADAPQQGQHTHSACDVCNGPALLVALFHAVPAPRLHSLMAPPAERFASVALQQGIKPPIS